MKTLAFALLIASGAVFAQGKTDYTLNDGQVKFSVPANWNAIMEKSDGNPQAVIFQVPDEAAKGTEDTASVTVKTRTLKSAADFAEEVREERDRSKALEGYEVHGADGAHSAHAFYNMRGKTRYLTNDRFHQAGAIVVQVRCQRPLIEGTPADWNAAFDAACAHVFASLGQARP